MRVGYGNLILLTQECGDNAWYFVQFVLDLAVSWPLFAGLIRVARH
jgi:hypothetical protein